MTKKKNTIPSEFEDVLGSIYSNAEGAEETTDMDTLMEPNVPLVDKPNDDVPPVNNPEDGNTADQHDDPNAHEDTTPEPDVKKPEPTKVDPEPNPEGNDDPTAEQIAEAQQVGLLFEAIGTSLGWNMDEIDDKDKPLTVDDLTQYFADVVKENSVPEYADDRIQALDEYVKNGGKFEDFYSRQLQALTLDNIDLEDENNQKAVIRELMQHSGYTQEQINKKIERYEDGDMLFEESLDALDRLKDIRQQEVEQARLQQEAEAKRQEEESMAFFNEVSEGIKTLDNIRGIAIPKEDRKALFDYIFKVDQNGLSQYTKDFNKNLSRNLIESAYFTMNADKFISTAKRDGESSAADKLRNLMRHLSKNHSTFNADEKQKSVTDLLNGMY